MKCNLLKTNATGLKEIACETDETDRCVRMKHGRCMNVTQFQFEPTVTTGDFRYLQQQSRFVSAGHSVHTAIDALMLGLRLRGWLTDSDKELLDRLAADNYLTFLIKGQKYLHPEGLDLFPLDLIQTARPEASGALFRHHYQPKSDPHCGGYVIHSAYISESEMEPITLGMFGGNRPSTQNAAETYFAELVERFRDATRRSEDFISRYGQTGDSDNPVMIVDRCSGRLFYTNPAADTLLGEPGRSLVGREFHEIKQRLSSLTGRYRWTLKNLDPDQYLFTVISLNPVTHVPGTLDHESTAQFFVHKMRNKIAGITTAASHLRTLSAEREADESREMAELIVSETGQLNDLIGNLHALIDFDNMPARIVDASSLLDDVLDQEVGCPSPDLSVENVPSDGDFSVITSVAALRSLLTAVFRAHRCTAGSSHSHRVRTQRFVDSGSVTLLISSESNTPGHRLPVNCEWRRYADELASVMHADLSWEEESNGASLLTRIELND